VSNKALTDKQRRFVEEYVVDFNATQAAIRAGYSPDTAQQIGSENLSKPVIQDAIQEIQSKLSEETGITAKRVIEEYAKIAFVDIREAFSVDNGLHDVRQIDDSTAAALSSVETFEVRQDGMVIGHTRKVKFHDKIRALEALGKHLGVFEKDNEQKKTALVNVINLGNGVKPSEDE